MKRKRIRNETKKVFQLVDRLIQMLNYEYILVVQVNIKLKRKNTMSSMDDDSFLRSRW